MLDPRFLKSIPYFRASAPRTVTLQLYLFVMDAKTLPPPDQHPLLGLIVERLGTLREAMLQLEQSGEERLNETAPRA